VYPIVDSGVTITYYDDAAGCRRCSVQSDSASTSRPTSEEFDAVSTSSDGLSRDEGFESAGGGGGLTARSYPDLQDQDGPGLGSPGSGRRGLGATTPCDGDETPVSAGTMFFARSNDSLVLQPRELVLSGETIDVDSFEEQPPPPPPRHSSTSDVPQPSQTAQPSSRKSTNSSSSSSSSDRSKLCK